MPDPAVVAERDGVALTSPERDATAPVVTDGVAEIGSDSLRFGVWDTVNDPDGVAEMLALK